ncbi:MBL fold metallo-hydrolase [Rubellicoccus peritrichatus]|uniref:MBL fold metallo-hydrolase n=1 Tax=Rubellicoccus peritrichatus TaxID=3080537 RepID=A0AAQ3LE39_9BACT|nr:MBL fold metallo-hydrolase [Puniceicoccus sp. CR14]WOO42804.1 MBL fold metallo-hydrolase [Puniceicoccus sp. CR14]
MEVIFLGTGTSQGVPMIAHESDGCDLANSKNWRTRSSIHVIMGGHRIQVDASPEFRLQCIRNGIWDIDTFILTHGHADHVLGMDDLRRFCDRRGFSAIPVYSTADGLKRVQQIYPYAIGDKPVSKGYAAFQIHEMPDVLETPGGLVRSVLLEHGAIHVLGLVFEEKVTGAKFVYYNDCKVVGDDALALAAGADIVTLDGLRPHPHPTHMTIDEAVEVAQKINAPQSYLTHMTFCVDHETWDAKLPRGINLAWDGLRLTL